jgi:glycine cleavage system H protein
MSNELKYTEDHEWIQVDGDVVSLGITEYAKNALGELVYVELPEVGDAIAKGDDFAVVESVKVASEVYSPVNGTIAEVNQAVQDDPEAVKGAPEDSWLVKIKIQDATELQDLMDKDAYEAYTKDLD